MEVTPVVRLAAVSKFYGKHRGVEDLDLSLHEGEILGLVGPNGSGKTTTLRVLLDLIRPTSGSASIFGLDTRADAQAIRRRLGVVLSSGAFPPRLTVEEYLAWLNDLRARSDLDQAALLAERLQLDTSRVCGELSTGNRQKVQLVQALMHQPSLLLLDEPTTGLDPFARREVHRLLAEHRATGGACILSSHVLDEIDSICDRVELLRDGRRISDGDLSREQRRTKTFTIRLDKEPDLDALSRLANVVRLEPALDPADGFELACTAVPPFGQLFDLLSPSGILDITVAKTSLTDAFLESVVHDAAKNQQKGQP